MKRVLVVEDSHMVTKVIRHVLGGSRLIQVDYAASMAAASALLDKQDYFCCLVDLGLPDAPSGEIVDLMLSKKLPCIVLTASFDEQRRGELLKKGVVDYVTKEGRYSYELALNTIHRLILNTQYKVLVVDDSAVQRRMLSQLFKLQLFNVYEAEDGVDAVKLILDNPDIRLLVTDYQMPRMDGFELVKNLRVKYEKSDLIIIGLSSEDDRSLSARFIKYGANDFLQKPFNHEEFFCRINHNVEFLELIERIKDAANRDELCACYSRSHFFRVAEQRINQAEDKNTPLSLAVLELEGFDLFNEQQGFNAGDEALKLLAGRLMKSFDRFFLARLGGCKFAVLMPGLDNQKACAYVEKVRQLLAASTVSLPEGQFSFGVAAGVSSRRVQNADQLLSSAISCLQRANDAGGDIVIGD
ncbi:response regulator [Agaribacterium haliotis]|uniref:response regulator n=1 Tax=Agaribacterium haliotis TaxID=2013869 RepID=UPI000BB56D47|nr:response regulator [Agaribacterium haliotis]